MRNVGCEKGSGYTQHWIEEVRHCEVCWAMDPGMIYCATSSVLLVNGRSSGTRSGECVLRQ